MGGRAPELADGSFLGTGCPEFHDSSCPFKEAGGLGAPGRARLAEEERRGAPIG